VVVLCLHGGAGEDERGSGAGHATQVVQVHKPSGMAK
jgi:hypothetical protein